MSGLDRLAIAVLLDSRLSPLARQRKLTALAAQAKARREGRVECPACGSMGPHDDNGRVVDRSFCCGDCGEHFDEEG